MKKVRADLYSVVFKLLFYRVFTGAVIDCPNGNIASWFSRVT